MHLDCISDGRGWMYQHDKGRFHLIFQYWISPDLKKKEIKARSVYGRGRKLHETFPKFHVDDNLV